jgi:hypothetical protein
MRGRRVILVGWQKTRERMFLSDGIKKMLFFDFILRALTGNLNASYLT